MTMKNLGLSILLFIGLFLFRTTTVLAQTNKELIATGVESFDNSELIQQAKKDLQIEKLSVKIILGAYYSKEGITGRLVRDLPNGYFGLVDKDFYQRLTLPERKALIGHELGHILYVPTVHIYDLDRTGLDICADFFAVRYAGVDAVLSLLEKLYTIPQDDRDQPDYKIRKAVLEEVRRN